MLRAGNRVTKLTKKVGQAAPEGKVVAIRGDSVEVRWDDGHLSIISRDGLVLVKHDQH
jgi:Cu2+-containing amine oxidase